MLHTALEFLKGSCGFWILSTVCRDCDSTDLGSGKLFCCGILWILDLVSGLCYGILGILDPVEPFCRRILWILDPVFWSRQRHVSDAHAVGTKRPEIQNSLFTSHTLHPAASYCLGKMYRKLWTLQGSQPSISFSRRRWCKGLLKI